MVRAKFICVSVTKRKGFGSFKFIYDADLHVVTDGSEENEKFWSATPAGSVRLSTLKADHFEVGQSYYVDFSPAA